MQQYKWIKANALQYGFKRIDFKAKGEAWEAWHWEDMSSFEESDFFSTAPKAAPDFTQFTR